MTTAIGTCGDDELIKRCLDGDRDSFTPIVERYQSLICAVTYSACGDLQFSEDLAQTTFLTAWRNLPTLKEPATIKSWLCGIARHLCADFLRHKRRTIRSSIELSSESDAIPALSQTPDQFGITHIRLLRRDGEALALPDRSHAGRIQWPRPAETLRGSIQL